MARPRKQIDWKQFDKLCELQCLQEEIAQWFDCTIDTIERACHRDKGMRFADYYAQKRGHGKIALRRKQMQTALKGNVTMMIWLGKQALGQSDKATIDTNTQGKLVVELQYVNEHGDNTETDSTAIASRGAATCN